MSRCHHGSESPSRREALKLLSCGFGFLALRGLMAEDLLRQEEAGRDGLRAAHHPAKAKRVIFLCMSGGPSHVDTFDYKPELSKRDGQTAPGRGRGKLLASPWQFSQHGQSGLWVSELFPEVAKHADLLCLLRGMHTDLPAHAQASLKLHTGSFQFVRPSLGAWSLYGLGTMNRNLPGFITINPPAGQGGAQNYGSAFLPAAYQGLRIGLDRGAGRVLRAEGQDPVENIDNDRLSTAAQRRQIDLVQSLNKERKKAPSADGGVDGVIESYELAFRMQAEVPGLLDLKAEKPETLKLYGIGTNETDGFGRQCLLARRFAEAGVRFIEINQGGFDNHRNLRDDLARTTRAIDLPIAGLLTDLKQRGLLKDTLVLWGGEFGRTPAAQNGDGRDHNNKGFTMWMAGGGVKGGLSYGSTDETGTEAVEGRVSMHEWHGTILHLLGLDFERLTYRHAGRDFRLTDVHGGVVRDILA